VQALTRAYGFTLLETPAGFDHIVGVTVLDAEGRISSHVYGKHITAQALGEPLRQLLLAAPAAAAGRLSLEQIIERVRILCTVYDPDTGEYRYDWTLLFQVFGGLGFFVTVAVYLWRERHAQRLARADGRLGAAH
jgi:protein SCO1/2